MHMRRKISNVANGREKAFVYTCALVALSVYAVPRLPRMTHGLAGTFTVLWLLFVALCVGANLYFLIGADKERKRLLDARTTGARASVPEKAQMRQVRG